MKQYSTRVKLLFTLLNKNLFSINGIDDFINDSNIPSSIKVLNEDGDEYYEYDLSDRDDLESLPSDIEDFCGLLDYHDECKANGDFDEEEMG